jgi:hypothetical protein
MIESWVADEYQIGISAHAAARQLCRRLEDFPNLKRLIEDLLADANRGSFEQSQTTDTLREVLSAIPKH